MSTLLVSSCSKENAAIDTPDEDVEVKTDEKEDSEKIDEVESKAIKALLVSEDGSAAIDENLCKAPLTDDEKQVASAMQQFSLKIVRELNNKNADGNFCYSPYSMSNFLSLILNGTKGDANAEVLSLIGDGGAKENTINSYNSKIRYLVENGDELVKTKVNNSVWIQHEFPVYRNFISTLEGQYGAAINAIDFGHANAGKELNQWCSDNTNGMINNIVEEGPLNYNMFIANALYVEGSWLPAFQKEDTKKAKFNNADGSQSEVDMMASVSQYCYMDCKEYEVAKIRMGMNYSMTVFLPKNGVSISKCLEAMTADKWNEAISMTDKKYVDLKLPKFNISKRWQNREILSSMGVKSLFSNSSCFGRITSEPAYLVEVFQDVKLDINENGCVGAAASYGGMVTSTGEESGKKPTYIPFYVNRPFFYTIQENTNGVMLFAGVVNKF